MTTAEAIYTALAGAAPVAALVADRIYPVRAPQGVAAPYVIFQHVASDPATTHGEPAGAVHRMFQFACFAATYEAAGDLRDAVTAALDDVALATGERPSLEDERDGDFDDAVGLHRADCDVLV